MEDYINLLTSVATDMLDWNDWYDMILKKEYVLKDVPLKYRDFEMCKIAVKNSCAGITDIPANVINEELCKEILQKDGLQLEYIDIEKRTYELCTIAAKNDGGAVQWIPEACLDNQMCLILIQTVKHSVNIFSFIQSKLNNYLTNELIKHHPEYFPSIPYNMVTKDICYKAVAYDGMFLKYVNNRFKSYDVCKKAVCIDGMALQFVPQKNIKSEIIMLSLHSNGMALQFVPEKMRTPGICQFAIRKNKNASDFVPSKL